MILEFAKEFNSLNLYLGFPFVTMQASREGRSDEQTLNRLPRQNAMGSIQRIVEHQFG